LLLAVACCWSGTASAAEMRSVDVGYEDSRYTMQSEVWFNAPLEAVYAVFSQWDLSTQFSSAIVKSQDLEPDEQGRPQFFVQNRGCLLFFCKTFDRQGYVESQPFEVLRAIANPETSDFLVSRESWTFRPENGGTAVVYEMLMQPKFWVPPGVGPYLIKRKLRKDGGAAVDRVEAIAQRIAQESGTAGD
jgi:hypothetical protein